MRPFCYNTEMAGHVYLIGSPLFRWYKIGKSVDAAIRVSDLGILLPFRIEVIAVWKVDNHHEVERLLHEKFSKSRINGEWFDLSRGEVERLVSEMRLVSVSVAAGFSNMAGDPALQDTAETIVTIKYEKNLTWEERKQRKEEAIAKRKARVRCPTCGIIVSPNRINKTPCT